MPDINSSDEVDYDLLRMGDFKKLHERKPNFLLPKYLKEVVENIPTMEERGALICMILCYQNARNFSEQQELLEEYNESNRYEYPIALTVFKSLLKNFDKSNCDYFRKCKYGKKFVAKRKDRANKTKYKNDY